MALRVCWWGDKYTRSILENIPFMERTNTQARVHLLVLDCVFVIDDALSVRSAIFGRMDELEPVPYEIDWDQFWRKGVFYYIFDVRLYWDIINA